MYSLQQAALALRSSLWLVPSLLVLASLALAFALISLEGVLPPDWVSHVPWLVGAQADGSRGMLSAIATSMITVAGVTFSITMSALAQASSQYSPLILRNFMRDRGNQLVLGVFGGIFVYCLVVLRSIRSGEEEFVPTIAVLGGLIYAIVSIGFLLYFIHHIATMLQASGILAMIGARTENAIDDLFPAQLGAGAEETGVAASGPLEDAGPRSWHPVCPQQSGYIQAVRSEAMAELACRHEAVVRMEHGIGEFAVREVPVASIALPHPPGEELRAAVAELFMVGDFRTIEQDAGFGVRQIVDMAVKALSPGVNDPTTACSCLDYLGAVLVRVAPRRLTTRERYVDGRLRVLAVGPTFEGLAALAFDQIRQSARNDATVLERMIATIRQVALHTRGRVRREAMLHHLRLVGERAAAVLEEASDRTRIAGLCEEARLAIEAAR